MGKESNHGAVKDEDEKRTNNFWSVFFFVLKEKKKLELVGAFFALVCRRVRETHELRALEKPNCFT